MCQGGGKKTPINFFLSLGKGVVQTYCPCFLMSALETTEILPSLARLVARISSHSTPPTDSPERSNFYLFISFLLVLVSLSVFPFRYCILPLLQPAPPLLSNNNKSWRDLFFPLETHTNTDTQTQKSLPPY